MINPEHVQKAAILYRHRDTSIAMSWDEWDEAVDKQHTVGTKKETRAVTNAAMPYIQTRNGYGLVPDNGIAAHYTAIKELDELLK